MWEWFRKLFDTAIQMFKELIKEALPTAKQILIGKLKPIGELIVKELQDKTLTNDEKREAAFKRIKDKAISQGIAVSDSIINLVIELLVQKLKR